MGAYESQPDLAALIQDLADRVAVLERIRGVSTGVGAPTTTPPDGALYIDLAASRLYARIAGAWKSAVLS